MRQSEKQKLLQTSSLPLSHFEACTGKNASDCGLVIQGLPLFHDSERVVEEKTSIRSVFCTAEWERSYLSMSQREIMLIGIAKPQ